MKPHGLMVGAFLLAAPLAAARAEVTLPALFGSGMVLQRDAPIRVWGKAAPGEKVTVLLKDRRAEAMAGADGKWQTSLKPLPAGGPYTLTVAGTNLVTLSDVLVGDVWLCGGQSNMQFSLQRVPNGEQVVAASADPQLRLFKVRLAQPETPAEDMQASATWAASGPQTSAGFSAVGYFFGRALRRDKNIPIGLISSCVGGTTGQAWTREAALTADADLKRRYVDTYPALKAEKEREIALYEAALARAKAEGGKEPTKPTSFWRYSSLYNGMIAPLTRFPVRGVLWYQGESNAKDPEGYRRLLPTLISDWRAQWGQPEMPFLLVQLPPFGSKLGNGFGWAELAEVQANAAKTLRNVGVVAIPDVGDRHDIHPTNKEPVGERLALLARKMVYGEKNLVASGPTFRSMKIEGSRVSIRFDNAGDGLEARSGVMSGEAVPADALIGFTVPGADGVFVPAEARITGKDTVEVWSSQVPEPKAVRYGFVNFPVVNLWNKNGLPAGPFRTDAPRR
jgi:sialate O-acetylesterase